MIGLVLGGLGMGVSEEVWQSWAELLGGASSFLSSPFSNVMVFVHLMKLAFRNIGNRPFRPRSDCKSLGSLLQEICILNLYLLRELKGLGFWWRNHKEMRIRQAWFCNGTREEKACFMCTQEHHRQVSSWASKTWARSTVGSTFCFVTRCTPGQ